MIYYLTYIWIFSVVITYVRAKGGYFEPIHSFEWYIILLFPAIIVLFVVLWIVGVVFESIDNWWIGGRHVR